MTANVKRPMLHNEASPRAITPATIFKFCATINLHAPSDGTATGPPHRARTFFMRSIG